MAIIEQFLDPVYMVAFFGIVELLKYLGVFKFIEDEETFEKVTPEFFKDVKKFAIFTIGALIGLVFMIAKFESLWHYEAGHYLVKLLVSLAVTTTCYEVLVKHLKNGAKKMFKRGKV